MNEETSIRGYHPTPLQTRDNTSWSEESWITPQPWMKDAKCVEVDPEIFFAEPNTRSYRYSYVIAKKVCASCPLATRRACLVYGLDEKYGMWGGFTPGERRNIRKQIDARVVQDGALGRGIDILRSLNANMRGEHS